MKYDIKDIRSAFFSSLNFLPMDVTPLWKTFVSELPKEKMKYKVEEKQEKTTNAKP